jgi:single-strand DNA-binding protein
MSDINVVTIKGRVTRDPELRVLPSGQSVASFSIANNRAFKNKEGELTEEVSFIDCEAFGQVADTIANHIKKGRSMFVTGRLRQDKWEDRETGTKRSKLVVKVEDFNFADSPPDRDQSQPQQEPPVRTSRMTARAPAKPTRPKAEPIETANDSNPPF